MTRRLGLGTRLSVYLLTVLLALQLLALLFYLTQLDERRRDRLDTAQRVAQNIAVAIDTHLRDIERTSVAVAEALAGLPRVEQALAGPYLARVIAEYPSLRAIFVTDPAGRVIATNGTGLGVDLSARPYLVALRAGAEKVWSGSLTGIESGEITVAFGRRIGAADAPRGHLLFAFYPERLLTSLSLAGAADSEIILTDDHGLVLYDSLRPTLSAAERDLSAVPAIRGALGGSFERISDLPLLGGPRYGAIVPVPSVKWAVGYLRPQGPLEDELRGALLGQIALASLVLLAAALLLIGTARRLTLPIAQLAREAGGIARGERPAIAVPASAGVEVQQLGDAMSAMSRAVATREDDLRFIAEASEILGSSLDYRQTLRAVARLIVPRLADLCLVDIVGAGATGRLEVAYVDERLAPAARALTTPRSTATRNQLAEQVLRGEPVLIPAVREEHLRAAAGGDDARLAAYTSLGAQSALIVPLVTRGDVLGALTLVRTSARGPYGARELSLARELARRAAAAVENARLYDEVQTALHTRDEFLSSVAHELKTPLTSVKGYSQLLERALDAGRLDPEPLRANLSRIVLATTRMNSSVEELLELARSQLGGIPEIERTTVDVVSLARDLAHEAGRTAPRHRIRVEAEREAIIGEWDRARIERVLNNLLSNAVKYSPGGGDVAIRLRTDGDAALIEVSDQGIGVPAADLARIFVRFYRGTNVVGRISGTGIGLTLVRQIVEQHGGVIAVESEPGSGTTFRVRLPLVAPP
jgi:signal transduction histidine kinase